MSDLDHRELFTRGIGEFVKTQMEREILIAPGSANLPQTLDLHQRTCSCIHSEMHSWGCVLVFDLLKDFRRSLRLRPVVDLLEQAPDMICALSTSSSWICGTGKSTFCSARSIIRTASAISPLTGGTVVVTVCSTVRFQTRSSSSTAAQLCPIPCTRATARVHVWAERPPAVAAVSA